MSKFISVKRDTATGFATVSLVLSTFVVLFGSISSCATAGVQQPTETGSAQTLVEIPIGDTPDGVTDGPDFVWVTVPGSIRKSPTERGWLYKIDPASNAIVSRIRVGKRPESVIYANGAVWVLNNFGIYRKEQPSVMRIDPEKDEVTDTFPVSMVSNIDADDSGLWLFGGLGDISRLDFQTMEVSRVREVDKGNYLSLNDGLASGAKHLWLLEGNWTRPWIGHGNVYRFDPQLGEIVSRTQVGRYSTSIAMGGGAVWVVNGQPREERGTVMRLDPVTASVEATIPLGRYPFFIDVCEGSVWVMNIGDGTLSRIDPETNLVIDTIKIPSLGRRIACGKGALWITKETANPALGSLIRLHLT